MKKITILTIVMFLTFFLVISTAHSFSLGISETTPYSIKFENWEKLSDPTYYLAHPDELEDGVEDNYGIFEITSIESLVAGAGSLWQSGDEGEYLFGVFHGIDTSSVEVEGGGLNVQSVGGTFEIYLATDYTYNEGLGTGGYIGGDHTQYQGITDQGYQSFLTFDLVAGIDESNHATIDGSFDSTTTPDSGDAAWYGSITGGDYAWMFDTNGYDTTYTDTNGTTQNGVADIRGLNDFTPNDGQEFPIIGDWDYKSDDPIYGKAATPEPATMLLFGIGLLGLAGIGRRKK